MSTVMGQILDLKIEIKKWEDYLYEPKTTYGKRTVKESLSIGERIDVFERIKRLKKELNKLSK